METKQQRQLIERYLSGQITGTELEDFNRRRQDDQAFANAVELHTWLHEGIESAYIRHCRDLAAKGIRYRKQLIPAPLKYTFIFLLVTFAGSLLWFYLAPDTGNNNPRISLFQPQDKSVTEPKTRPAKKKSTIVPASHAPDSVSEDKDVAAAPLQDTAAPVQAADEFIVKKDEMLIAFDVPVTDLNDKPSGKDDLANAAAEKLNPAAGLPEQTEAITDRLTTEFWISPINYHGYRLVNNKLILFGIEEPDRVKLYRMKDFLYMNYQNSYYKLVPSDDFLAYQRIKDTDVPLAIRSSR